jgi:IMP dehydrogenase
MREKTEAHMEQQTNNAGGRGVGLVDRPDAATESTPDGSGNALSAAGESAARSLATGTFDRLDTRHLSQPERLDMRAKFAGYALTFDDVLLLPGRSDVLPTDVDTSTQLTKRIRLAVPILSSPMDTVTEARMAIALAREGGLGVIHRNLSIQAQAEEVDKVKRSEAGMIVEPVTLRPHDTLADAEAVMRRYHISGVPITEQGKLVGILTNRDTRFETDLSRPISEVMTSENLITAPVGTTLDQAKTILGRHKIEKLPIVDEAGQLKGLITVKDIQKKLMFPLATKDGRGRLRVAAGIGVGPDAKERATELVNAGVDVLVVDVAHGHSEGVIGMIRWLKEQFEVDVIGGNVATVEGARDLIEAGSDALRVGIGASAICTTRVVTGAGVPQLTAIYETAQEAANHGISVVADGGIQYSGEIAKAIAAGASVVMLGTLLAGVDESPGEILIFQGEHYKEHRGMGSIGAMQQRGFSRDRYAQMGVFKTVPEGIEGRVQYKGKLADLVYQLVGGLQAGMHYVGARNVEEMHRKAQFIRISGASLRESHPHDIVITKEAPNYGLFSGPR